MKELSATKATQQAQELFSKIKQKFVHSNWLIALDRDGTLVPLQADPKEAVVTPDVRDLLEGIAEKPNVQVIIISARGNKQLKVDFSSNLILAGNYGLEISYPNEITVVHPKAEAAKAHLSEVTNKFINWLKENPQAIFEDHELSLCLHWHLLLPVAQAELHQLVEQMQEEATCLNVRKLPTSYEFLPNIDWNKAMALEQIEQKLGAAPDNCLYLYIGDSASDEPGFTWANDKGGISIRVGNSVDSSGSTAAEYEAESPEVVYQFLRMLAAFINQKDSSISK